MTTWWLGTEYKTPKANADSVIQDLHVWNVFNKGYFNYFNHRLIIDGLITRGNNPKDSACCSIGFEGGDYFLNNFTLRSSDIQGFKTGVNPTFTQGPGFQRIEDSSIQAATGIQMATLKTSAYKADNLPRRSVEVRNVIFTPIPGMPFRAIKMLFNAGPVSNLIQLNTITVTDYNGTSGPDFHVYYKEQAATFVVPQSVWNADGTTKVTGSPKLVSPMPKPGRNMVWPLLGACPPVPTPARIRKLRALYAHETYNRGTGSRDKIQRRRSHGRHVGSLHRKAWPMGGRALAGLCATALLSSPSPHPGAPHGGQSGLDMPRRRGEGEASRVVRISKTRGWIILARASYIFTIQEAPRLPLTLDNTTKARCIALATTPQGESVTTPEGGHYKSRCTP